MEHWTDLPLNRQIEDPSVRLRGFSATSQPPDCRQNNNAVHGTRFHLIIWEDPRQSQRKRHNPCASRTVRRIFQHSALGIESIFLKSSVHFERRSNSLAANNNTERVLNALCPLIVTCPHEALTSWCLLHHRPQSHSLLLSSTHRSSFDLLSPLTSHLLVCRPGIIYLTSLRHITAHIQAYCIADWLLIAPGREEGLACRIYHFTPGRCHSPHASTYIVHPFERHHNFQPESTTWQPSMRACCP